MHIQNGAWAHESMCVLPTPSVIFTSFPFLIPILFPHISLNSLSSSLHPFPPISSPSFFPLLSSFLIALPSPSLLTCMVLKVRDTSPGGPDAGEQPPPKKNGLGCEVVLQCSKKLSSEVVSWHYKGGGWECVGKLVMVYVCACLLRR